MVHLSERETIQSLDVEEGTSAWSDELSWTIDRIFNTTLEAIGEHTYLLVHCSLLHLVCSSSQS